MSDEIKLLVYNGPRTRIHLSNILDKIGPHPEAFEEEMRRNLESSSGYFCICIATIGISFALHGNNKGIPMWYNRVNSTTMAEIAKRICKYE